MLFETLMQDTRSGALRWWQSGLYPGSLSWHGSHSRYHINVYFSFFGSPKLEVSHRAGKSCYVAIKRRQWRALINAQEERRRASEAEMAGLINGGH